MRPVPNGNDVGSLRADDIASERQEAGK